MILIKPTIIESDRNSEQDLQDSPQSHAAHGRRNGYGPGRPKTVIYLNHFGLREPPFGITPDTSFFFACASSQEALNTLLVAVANGEGFIKITGEVGTGKTLLCRKLLATLADNCVTAYIPNPNLEPRTLLFALCEELRIEVDADLDQHRLHKALNHALLDFARASASAW